MSKANQSCMTDIDKYVSEKIKSFRKERKLFQTHLAAELGVSFQQIQKYENGVNRVSAGQLWVIAKFLNYDIIKFFPTQTRIQKILEAADKVYDSNT